MTDFRSMIDELKIEKAKFNKMLAEKAEPIFFGLFAQVKEKYPFVESFTWSQGTPGFCDGDVCEFSVYSYDPDINGLDSNEYEYTNEDEQYIEAAHFIEEFLDSIPTDLFRFLGDPVQVTLYVDRMDVAEWEIDF